MQLRGVVLLLALVAAESLSATSQARLFLRRHAGKPPRADELAELKDVNPEAYALVKALLTKRSLGLLNPRHPTASFAAPSKEQQTNEDASEQGPEVFAKFASPGELAQVHQHVDAQQVALPYGEVQPAAQHDWINWKPQSAATDDDAMVANVLGAVAELKGKKAGLLSKSRAPQQESSLAADEASFSVEPAPVAAPKPVAAAAPKENSYLKSIDFGIRAHADKDESQEAPVQHENSYLKNFMGDQPKVALDGSELPSKPHHTSQVQDSSNNALASFDWNKDDSEPKPVAVKHVETKAEAEKSNLLSWLGVTKSAPQPKVAPAAAKPSNPYLTDLS